MSADRVDRTWAVTTRLTKRDPTNQKSVRERLRKIWHLGFREGRNVGGPTRSDTGRHDPSNKTRPDKGDVSLREIGFREDRHVGGPSRLDMGRHDPSNKTRPDKPEVS